MGFTTHTLELSTDRGICRFFFVCIIYWGVLKAMNATLADTTISCEDATSYLMALFAASTCLSEWLGLSDCKHSGILHGIVNILKARPKQEHGDVQPE